MKQNDPVETVEQFISYINAGRVEDVLSFYEETATFVAEPGVVVSGKQAIGEAFSQLVAMNPTLTSTAHEIIQSEDIALYCTQWEMTFIDPDGKSMTQKGVSSDVLRRQGDGRWLIAIDNPFGPEIIK